VSIAFGHSARLVAKKRLHALEAHAPLHQPRCVVMPKVVDLKIRDPGATACRFKASPETSERLTVLEKDAGLLSGSVRIKLPEQLRDAARDKFADRRRGLRGLGVDQNPDAFALKDNLLPG